MSVYDDHEILGERLPGEVGLELGLLPEASDEQYVIENMVPTLSSKEVVSVIDDLERACNFQEHKDNKFLKVAKGVISFTTSKGSYDDRMEVARQKTGEQESSKYGVGEFDGKQAVMFIMNFEFTGGSVGLVTGKKYKESLELAKSMGLPHVSIFGTGGIRQDENMLGLFQMPLMVQYLREFYESSDLPTIGLFVGPVAGGKSASNVSLTDTNVATLGSTYCFAGSRVIGAFEGVEPYDGSQRSEVLTLNRDIEVSLGADEAYRYISKALHIFGHQANSKPDLSEDTKFSGAEENRGRSMTTASSGFYTPRISTDNQRRLNFDNSEPVDVYSDDPFVLDANYKKIYLDPNRPDGEFILRTVFDDFLPLYNHLSRPDKVSTPAIIGAYALLDGQEVMVFLNQPTYLLRGDRVVKKSAMPTPEDFDWFQRQVRVGTRRKLPIISWIDTLGAEPTIRAERRGQPRVIADSMDAIAGHPYPFLSVVGGGLGSGGGIGIANVLPKLFALDYAQLWVAEPRSATSIMERTDNPSPEQIRNVIKDLKCRPQDCIDLGLPIEIIKTDPNPMLTAKYVYEALRNEYWRQKELGVKGLAKERVKVRDQIGSRLLVRHP